MTKLHIPSTIDTSNPVGDVVIKPTSRTRSDLVSTLMARIRHLVDRSRRVHANKGRR